MRGESSEQRRGSATITNGADGAALGGDRASARLFLAARALCAVLLAGTASCSATATGSVGAVLGKDNGSGRLFVREAPAGMGAAKAGLAPGDEVIAIEGKPVTRMSPPEIHDALAGKVGTTVRVTVVRDGTTLDYVIARGPLQGA